MDARGGGASAVLAASCALALGACGGDPFTVAAGGSPVDAGGGVDSAAPAPAYCASRAAQLDFCSDFDEAALPENWDGITKTGASQIAEDGADSTSPPTSALMTTPALGGAVGDGAAPTVASALTKRGLPVGTAHVAFDLELGEVSFPNPADPKAALALATVGVGKDGYALYFALRPAAAGPFGAALIEIPSTANASKATGTAIKALPKLASWSHVQLDVTLQAAGATCVVTIDGASQSIAINPPLTATVETDRTLTVGLLAAGPIGEAKARFDDVTWSH